MESTRLYITEENKQDILTTSRWGKFLAIIGYLAVGLMTVVGLLSLIGGFFAQDMFGSAFPFPIWIFGLIYILIAALYFMPIHKMYLMCDNMRKAVDRNDQTAMNLAFSNMSKSYKYSGIMVISIMILYFFMIIGFVIYGMNMKNNLTDKSLEPMEQLETMEGEEELDTNSYELDTVAVK